MEKLLFWNVKKLARLSEQRSVYTYFFHNKIEAADTLRYKALENIGQLLNNGKRQSVTVIEDDIY